MTRRKVISDYVPLKARLGRIANLSQTVATTAPAPNDPETLFLALALHRISKGEGAAAALDVKARRGERRTGQRSGDPPAQPPGTIGMRLNRISGIADALALGNSLPEGDRHYLQAALQAVATGIAPDLALGVRAPSGTKKSWASRRKHFLIMLARHWIASAIEADGPHETEPKTRSDAIAEAADAFHLSYENLRKVWTHAHPKPSSVFRMEP